MKLTHRLPAYAATCTCLAIVLWSLGPHSRSSRHTPRRAFRGTSTSPIKNEARPAPKEDVEKLRQLFKNSDTTLDGRLSIKELSWSIGRSVERHLQSALKNNFRHFFKLDRINHNGQVEWEEWMDDFRHRNGLDKDSDLTKADRRVKERLAAAKAGWSEAARSNPDALNIDEFLSFTHPESSHSMLAQTAEETMGRYDANDDGKISLDEYLNDPFVQLDEQDVLQRKKEFAQAMDANQNGYVDKRELLTYLDPKHPSRAHQEAETLMAGADANNDGYIDWHELESRAADFFDSKWASPERVFHGDL